MQVSCDASPFGIGAVLSHIGSDGEEHPVAYASRTLSDAERNYAQFERETLAFIYAVKRFHKYLYGRTFSIMTDHKPLIGVFGPGRSIPNMASSRMVRWCLILQAYKYDIRHRSGDCNQNADALSFTLRSGADFNATARRSHTPVGHLGWYADHFSGHRSQHYPRPGA